MPGRGALRDPGVFSGRWYEVHAYPWPDGLTVQGRDVSGRRRAEEALRESTADLPVRPGGEQVDKKR